MISRILGSASCFQGVSGCRAQAIPRERSRALASSAVLSPQCDGMTSFIFMVPHWLREGIKVPCSESD